MAYIRNSFLRMYPWRRTDAAVVSPSIAGTETQFDYWFGWRIPDTFYLPPVISPDLENPVATNAASYAENPSGGITTLQVRMFDQIFADLVDKHSTTPGLIRRRNIAYSLGPDSPGVTGENLFRRGWATWSPPTTSGCVFTARITDTGSGFEVGSPIDLCAIWPQHESYLHGYKANLSACWDMAAKPILAWESAIDTISVLRLEEGHQTFTGYSPLLQCNAALVEVGQRFTNTDTILWYLKDDGGYTGTWNYNTLYGPTVPDNGVRQVADIRRSSKLYFRIQRENFEVEHVMCDLPFSAQNLDHILYDGRLWDDTYNAGIYSEGSIIRDPATHPTKWCLALTLVDGAGSRYVLVSQSYFSQKSYALGSASDTATLGASVIGGALEDVSVTPQAQYQPTTDAATLAPSITGALLNTSVVASAAPDSATMATSVLGSCATTVTNTVSGVDSFALAPAVSGVVKTMVISSGPHADTKTISVSVSGSLVTV